MFSNYSVDRSNKIWLEKTPIQRTRFRTRVKRIPCRGSCNSSMQPLSTSSLRKHRAPLKHTTEPRPRHSQPESQQSPMKKRPSQKHCTECNATQHLDSTFRLSTTVIDNIDVRITIAVAAAV